MPFDYDAITREIREDHDSTVERVGEYLSIQYGDRTHFVYELLQNAEDVGAKRVVFRLYRDRLEFEHDGDHFDEDDIRAICKLVFTTKANDPTKIGKFGVGFMAVYAFTRAPMIHSGSANFVITNYEKVAEAAPQKAELGTKFILPFDHPDLSAPEAFDTIASRLSRLGLGTLLFLNCIQEIVYEIEDTDSGIYLRQTDDNFSADSVKRVRVLAENGGKEVEEQWIVFQRQVAHLVRDLDTNSESSALTVQIGFRLFGDASDVRPIFVKLNRSPLNVFFPTDKETHLGFLAQGPYRTTPARDNVPKDDEFNIALAKETGELVVEALRWLRDKDWLSVDVLETMPLAYKYRNFGWQPMMEVNAFRNTLFEPIYERVKRALVEEPLLPAYGGGYVSAENARIAGSEDLRKLLNGAQLQELLGFGEETRWLSADITEDRARELWRYLTTLLDVEEIDTEMFARSLKPAFLATQSDDWIRRLYEFLPSGRTMREILESRPIIRLANGKQVPPIRSGEAQAYLPSDYGSQFPTVKREVCDSGKALRFLKNLGLKQPDIVDEVLRLVLPKYRKGNVSSEAEHRQDLELVARAIDVDSYGRRRQLLDELRDTPFLRAKNTLGGDAYRRPDEVYHHSDALLHYFAGNSDAWFLSDEYEEYRHLVDQLGVACDVRTKCRRPPRGERDLLLRKPRGERGSKYDPYIFGLDGFDPDVEVDGLETAIRNICVVSSRYIWNDILIQGQMRISGIVKRSPRRDGSNVIDLDEKVSAVGRLLRESAWLPDRNGGFCLPSELSLDDLPEDFRRDDALADALGMRLHDSISIEKLLADNRLKQADREKLQQLQSIPNDQLDWVLRNPHKITEHMKKESVQREQLRPEKHQAQLEEDFEKPAITKPTPPSPPIAIDNENLVDEIANAPDASERSDIAPKRVWEARNPETRSFLMQEYDGLCQICGETFAKRNGDPYFEAIHLIARAEASWLDHPRNAICLCANHAAQWKHGEREALETDIVSQISFIDEQDYHIDMALCGAALKIQFTEAHGDALKALVDATEQLAINDPAPASTA